MRLCTLAAAAFAVVAMAGCDQPALTGPDAGSVHAAESAEPTLPRADADDLFARLLPAVDANLAQKLRGLLDRERIGADDATAALRTLDETPGAERDAQVGAVRVTIEAMLRVLALGTGSTEAVTR
jgi:hypothetical protein